MCYPLKYDVTDNCSEIEQITAAGNRTNSLILETTHSHINHAVSHTDVGPVRGLSIPIFLVTGESIFAGVSVGFSVSPET